MPLNAKPKKVRGHIPSECVLSFTVRFATHASRTIGSPLAATLGDTLRAPIHVPSYSLLLLYVSRYWGLCLFVFCTQHSNARFDSSLQTDKEQNLWAITDTGRDYLEEEKQLTVSQTLSQGQHRNHSKRDYLYSLVNRIVNRKKQAILARSRRDWQLVRLSKKSRKGELASLWHSWGTAVSQN